MVDIAMFGENYSQSRETFLTCLGARGAAVGSYRSPGGNGPRGEPLYIDVGLVGPPKASKSLLILSGVHGTEATISTGLLNDLLMSEILTRLPTDMNVVLVHALNPWGMAHETRTTENNVDLNRNFVDFSTESPENSGYAELHPLLCPSDIEIGMEDLRKAIGASAKIDQTRSKVDAIMRGQYQFADGINFGGFREEWSNRILRHILAEHLPQAQQIACIDWHTGIGESGEAVPLAFYPSHSRAAVALSDWHGQNVTLFGDHFPGGEAPRFTGILNMALPSMVPERQTYAVVVEFGTKPNAEVLDALMIDRWLKFSADPQSSLARRLKREMMECFSPTDPSWRLATLETGRRIVLQTIDGLASV